MPKVRKNRDFAFILYPDNVNPDWERLLIGLQQPVFWILHDKDVFTDKSTGEVMTKKPHYHVQIVFDNPRSVNSISKLAVKCGGNGHLEDIISRKGYARYLIHLDDPEKHRYLPSEVVTLNGADYERLIKTKSEIETDEVSLIKEIILFVRNNQVHIYADLVDYCVNERTEWLKLLMSNKGRMIRDYIKSMTYAHLCVENLNRFKV